MGAILGAVWELGGAVAVAVGAPIGAVGAMGAVVLAVCKAVRVGVLVLVGAVCIKAV